MPGLLAQLNGVDTFIAISLLLFVYSVQKEYVSLSVTASSPINGTGDNCDQAQTHCATRDTLFNLDNISSASTSSSSATCKSGTEFSCVSRLQCIPMEFVCDRQYDCQDQSDEIGCSAPSVISEPPRALYGLEHGAINISCEASGLPRPSIHWTHNGFNLTGNEAEILSSSTTQIGTSGVPIISDVYGSQGALMYYVMSTVQFVNLNQQDAGYWACHASNNQGNTSSSIETLLTVRQKAQICQQQPYFNDLATSEDECLKCYCSGVSDTCFSSSYYLSKLHVATRPRVVNILSTVSVLHSSSSSSISNNDNDYRQPNNGTNGANKMIGEQKRYRSYEEAETQDNFVLPDYHNGLSQYRNEDRQAMLNNVHNGLFYYYKIEPDDIEDSRASFQPNDQNNGNNTDFAARQRKWQHSGDGKSAGLSLIRSYGGYMRFSFTFGVSNPTVGSPVDYATDSNDTVPVSSASNNGTDIFSENQSLLQDLADVILVCGNGDVIYHHYDIYSTSIVANQNNHLSVPLTENYWLMAINRPVSSMNHETNKSSATRNRQQDSTAANKKSGTAPYNYDVNSHQLASSAINDVQQNKLSLLSQRPIEAIQPTGPQHRVTARRSDYFNDMVFARHGVHHLAPSRDKFMFCLSDVRALYIRAIYDVRQITFNVSSIYIDTAVGGAVWNSTMGSDLQASLVEQCVCPTGHEGSSCELCSNSFDRYLAAATSASGSIVSSAAAPRVLCKLKVRGEANRSGTSIGSVPTPHYSHYYNQSASILPVLSTNDNNNSSASPQPTPATSNSHCADTGSGEQCKTPANNCANDHQSPYCDIPTTATTTAAAAANNSSGDLSSFVVAIEEPKNLSVAVGAFVRFTCTVSRVNSTSDTSGTSDASDSQANLTLVWSRLFRPSAQYTSSSTVVKQLQNGAELQLYNVTLEDIGLYMCELGHNVSDIKVNSSASGGGAGEMRDPRRDFANLSVDLAAKSAPSGDSTDDADLADYDSGDGQAAHTATAGSNTTAAGDSGAPVPAAHDTADTAAQEAVGSANYAPADSAGQLFLASPSHEQTIRIIPGYSEAPLGSSLQLTCVSDSDQPDLQQVEWSHATEDQLYPGGAGNNSNLGPGEPVGGAAPARGVTIIQNSLMINSVIDRHAGVYTCRATNGFNITSEALARVVIVPGEETPPQVYIEPEKVTGRLNEFMELRCFASGRPGPKLSWHKVGQPGGSGGKHIAGPSAAPLGPRLFETEQVAQRDIHLYTDQWLLKPEAIGAAKKSYRRAVASVSLLKIDTLSVAHAGQYICRAHNSKGSNQASAVLEVDYEMQPTIRVAPLEQTVRLDSQHEARIACHVLEGRPRPKISWFKLSTGAVHRLAQSRRGVESMLRTVHHRAPESTSAQHFVSLVPHLLDLSTAMATGGASAASSAALDIHNINIQDTGAGASPQMSVLSLKRVTTSDDGTYICMAENKLGRHSVVASLQVVVPATVKIMQAGVMNANEDDSFQLECLASGHPLPINLEWTKRHNRLPYFSLVSRQQQHEQQERAVLRFDRIDANDAGEYICQAKNNLDDGVIYDSVQINVAPRSSQQQQNVSGLQETDPKLLRPQLFTRPVKMVAPVGANVTIDCLAMSGRQPILIEWLSVDPAAPAAGQRAGEAAQQAGDPAQQADEPVQVGQQRADGYRGDNRVRNWAPANSSATRQQVGSKIRLYNVSRHDEGAYQCVGYNKYGRDAVTAELRVVAGSPSAATQAPEPGRQQAANGSASPATNPPGNQATSDTSKQATGDTSKQATGDTQLLTQSKTMVAYVGSNIELTCRVEGVLNPAISWSREGEQLPRLSLQLGHNLWIQSVNKNDTGRYICSARPSAPNKIIQDNVTLLVRESISASDTLLGRDMGNRAMVQQLASHRWTVSIVPSKRFVRVGDSITLECLIKLQTSNNNNSNSSGTGSAALTFEPAADELDSLVDADGTIKREISAGLGPVTWTNSNTGQGWFQDNVYTQDNLLIIYDLRPENTAIYRCTHNDLQEHDEFALTIVEAPDTDGAGQQHSQEQRPVAPVPTTAAGSGTLVDPPTLAAADYAATAGSAGREQQKLRRSLVRRVPIESRVVLQCPFDTNRAKMGDVQADYASALHDTSKLVRLDQRDVLHYWWTKWGAGSRLATNQPYTINSVSVLDADVYVCQGLLRQAPATNQPNHANGSAGPSDLQPQQPPGKQARFYYLPTVLAVDRLIARFVQNPVSFIAYPTITGAYFQLKIEIRFLAERDSGLILYNGQYKPSGDFISLGLNRGHVEFRFELGDGLTLLRSVAPVTLNRWHNVLVERDRRKATLLVDQQPVVSNSSTGKFHNLDLDSLLYIGGHQYYYDRYQANNLANSRQLNRRLAVLGQSWPNGTTTTTTTTTATATTATTATTKFYGFSQGFHGCISHLRVSNQDINLATKDRTVSIGIYECQHNQCHGSKCNPNNSVCQHDDLASSWSASSDGPADGATTRLDTRLRCICLPGYQGRDCNEPLARHAQQNDACQQPVNPQRAHKVCNQPFGRCAGARSNPALAAATDNHNTGQQHHCECKLGFAGPRCDERIMSAWHQQQLKRSAELSFDSALNSWLAIRQTRISNGLFKVKIQLKLRPNWRALQAKDALILYSSQSASGLGDHIMLALRQDGHLEFNLDTGSGVTSIRSQNAIVAVHDRSNNNNNNNNNNQPWTSVTVERSLNELIMRIDDQPEIVRQLTADPTVTNQQQQQQQAQHLSSQLFHNSSRSVLNIGLPFYVGDIDRNRKMRLPAYAQFFRPFDGCLSQLTINDYEYDFSTLFLDSNIWLGAPEDAGQYDAAFSSLPDWFLDSSNIKLCTRPDEADQRRPTVQNNARDTPAAVNANGANVPAMTNANRATGESVSQDQSDLAGSTVAPAATTAVSSANKNQICDILSPCAAGATCYPIGTALYKCHCPIGLMGDTCSMQAVYTPETTVQFNQNAYISLRFANLDEIAHQQQQQQQQATNNSSSSTQIMPKSQPEDSGSAATGQPASPSQASKASQFKLPVVNASGAAAGGYNLTLLAKQLSMTEQQIISFTLVTSSNYGIIFYLGQVFEQQQSTGASQQQQQASASAKAALTSDYIAIALVDGYIEVSYELGSGVALIRSATKVNDDNYHKITVTRNGRFAMLTIDGTYIQEGLSPGKLSMLNALGDIYLGGLPNASQITNNRYMTGFQGCLLDFELNRHGPVNLIRSDALIQITSGRNVSPCMRKSKILGSASSTASDDGEESDN